MRALGIVDVPSGNRDSEQAEASSGAPLAAKTDMRILIEVQVQTLILAQAFGLTDQVDQLRKDVAGSIT